MTAVAGSELGDPPATSMSTKAAKRTPGELVGIIGVALCGLSPKSDTRRATQYSMQFLSCIRKMFPNTITFNTKQWMHGFAVVV